MIIPISAVHLWTLQPSRPREGCWCKISRKVLSTGFFSPLVFSCPQSRTKTLGRQPEGTTGVTSPSSANIAFAHFRKVPGTLSPRYHGLLNAGANVRPVTTDQKLQLVPEERARECKGWGQRACKRASKVTSGMDNGGGQRKTRTNSPRGRIHSHRNLAISLTLGMLAGQLKQKSERLKPAKHQCFSPPASHPSARAQPPADKGQSISSHKPRSQVLRKEGNPCFGALTGNQQGALKDRNNAVSHKHTEGNARHLLPKGAAALQASHWSLCQAPHTTGRSASLALFLFLHQEEIAGGTVHSGSSRPP